MKNTVALKDTPWADIKREALTQAQEAHIMKTGKRLTLEMLHVRTGIPLSNISRYFNDPDYNPSPENIPILCRAMDNDLMIEWLAAQRSGVFVRFNPATDICREKIAASVNNIQRSASDLLNAALISLSDGHLTAEEVRMLADHFRRIAQQAEAACLESAG